jgi:hypothetical protein
LIKLLEPPFGILEKLQELRGFLPGAELNLDLKVEPKDGIPTASYTAQVNVFARRVSEESAPEALIGSGEMVVKYESDIVVGAQIGRNVGRLVTAALYRRWWVS